MIGAFRYLYRRAEGEVQKPRRLVSTRHALPIARLAEINACVAATGDDPALDVSCCASMSRRAPSCTNGSDPLVYAESESGTRRPQLTPVRTRTDRGRPARSTSNSADLARTVVLPNGCDEVPSTFHGSSRPRRVSMLFRARFSSSSTTFSDVSSMISATSESEKPRTSRRSSAARARGWRHCRAAMAPGEPLT